MHHPIVVNTPVKPFNSYENNPDSDSDKIIDSKDSEPEVYCQNVSDCIFYNTYDPNFDGAEYYSKYVEGYVNEDVTRHATVPAIIIGENDNFEYMGYVCENCEHVFLSPEEQDKEILTVSQYTLVNALQVAFIDCVNNGDEKGAESLYHIIDDIRVMAGAYRYEYCDANGRYVSPMQYQYTAEDIDNYVIINMQKYDTAVEAAQKANLEFVWDTSKFLVSVSGIPILSFAMEAIETLYKHYNEFTAIEQMESLGNTIWAFSEVVSRNKIPIIKDISDSLTITSYLSELQQICDDINTLAYIKNNYSITIELQNSTNRTIYDYIYQFNSIDTLYSKLNVISSENSINNPNVINSYIVNPNNVSDLFYPTGWSETIVD